MVFLIQILYGLCILFPYLNIVGCLDFYMEKMPDNSPQSTFTFCIYSTLVPGIIVHSIYGNRFSNTRVTIVCCGASTVMMIVLPFLANIGGTTGYWLTIGALLVFGFIDGVL
jgi:hypothetical protein